MNGIPNTSNKSLICKPSILFDELHVLWFIEFLQQMCESFIETIWKDQGEDCPVAIIVDNSPGYIGIAPAIQEWLTDLGPDKGKFLIISSPDEQDLRSCGHAIYSLNQLYKSKWKTSRRFVAAKRQKGGSDINFELDSEEKRFYLRLVEANSRRKHQEKSASNINNINGIDLPFYYKDNDKIGDVYLHQLEKYQGLVINRVPRLANWSEYDYKMKSIYTRRKNKKNNMYPKVMERLLGEKRGMYFDCMVTYEESIEYQFLQPMISRKTVPVLQDKRQFIDTIETNYSIPSDIEGQFMSQVRITSSRKVFEIINERRDYLQKVHGKVKDVISLAEEYGFSHITHLIHEEWLPINIMGELPLKIQDILLKINKEIPSTNLQPWGLGKENINLYMEEFIKGLTHEIQKQNYTVNNKIGGWFFPSLIVVAALSLSQHFLDPSNLLAPKIEKDLKKIIIAIYRIEVEHWKKQSKK